MRSSMEKQGPARAGIFSMNIPALRRDERKLRETLSSAEARAGGVGRRGGQKLGQVQIRKGKQQKHREECAWASELKRIKFNMQWIRSGSSVSKSENAGTSHFFSPQPNPL